MPTVPTVAVRETDDSRHNGGTEGAPLKPPRDDSALRSLSRALEAPEIPPLCRETQSLGQQMLRKSNGGQKWVNSNSKTFFPSAQQPPHRDEVSEYLNTRYLRNFFGHNYDIKI